MACTPEHPFPFPNPRGAPRFRQGLARVGHCSLDELLGTLVVLEHHATVEARQLHGRETIVVKRGGDRAAHLAERGELVDRSAQLLRTLLQLLEQPHVLDGDHRLVGEGLDETNLLIAEFDEDGARSRSR